jgi:L-amino acid N-acyltransferase YncA
VGTLLAKKERLTAISAMSEIHIRPATASDVSAIAAIYRPAVLKGTATFELEPPSEAEMKQRLDAIVVAGYPYLVAEVHGEVLGFAYTNTYRSRPAYRFTVEDSIYVAEGAHGRGIGRRLLAELIAEAEKRGFRQMIAVIGDSGQAASIALHRAAGFTFSGTLHAVGLKFDRWLDSVLMQRPLGSGERSLPD